MINMPNGISITEARNNMSRLPQKLAKRKRALAVTKRGKPIMAIMEWAHYETLEILADPELMAQIRASERELSAGKGIPWEEVKKRLGW
jgi:PHD/YefM family antitoxin component YafN of YafNO toxin-antitoxin module